MPLAEVEDEAFAGEVLGKGIAIEPTEGKLFSPVDGTVDNLFDTNHAIGISNNDGVEILLHIGIDTVQLNGKYFKAHVKTGQEIKKGDLLISFEIDKIKEAGYKVTTPMIICNTDDYKDVTAVADGNIEVGQDLLKLVSP